MGSDQITKTTIQMGVKKRKKKLQSKCFFDEATRPGEHTKRMKKKNVQEQLR